MKQTQTATPPMIDSNKTLPDNADGSAVDVFF